MERGKWIWMPHVGHLSVGSECRFHLNTYVGKYIVSTVGEYFPDSAMREILAARKGVEFQGKGDFRDADYLRKVGFEEIGLNRLYETMVFKACQSPPSRSCCPWEMTSGELDYQGYNDPRMAYMGHVKICNKWSRK